MSRDGKEDVAQLSNLFMDESPSNSLGRCNPGLEGGDSRESNAMHPEAGRVNHAERIIRHSLGAGANDQPARQHMNGRRENNS